MDMDNESIRVLLVEDNPGDAALIQQALSEADAARFLPTHVQRLSELWPCFARGPMTRSSWILGFRTAMDWTPSLRRVHRPHGCL